MSTRPRRTRSGPSTTKPNTTKAAAYAATKPRITRSGSGRAWVEFTASTVMLSTGRDRAGAPPEHRTAAQAPESLSTGAGAAGGATAAAGTRSIRIPAYAMATVSSGLTMLKTAKGA